MVNHARIREPDFKVEMDLVDRIVVVVDVPAEALDVNQEHLLLGFTGAVAFYKQSVDPMSTSTVGAQLAATWRFPVNHGGQNVYNNHYHRSGEVPRRLEFEAPISPHALNRLEDLRAGGPLYARIEGFAFVLEAAYVGGRQITKDQRPMFATGLDASWNTPQGPRPRPLNTECIELHAEKWSRLVLSKLRPPGSFIVEVTPAAPKAAAAADVLGMFAKAQAAFDDGRWDEVARNAYIVLEKLQEQGEALETRYGSFGRDQILVQMKNWKTLCDRERHKDRPNVDPVRFDSPLAQRLLADTAGMMGLVFR